MDNSHWWAKKLIEAAKKRSVLSNIAKEVKAERKPFVQVHSANMQTLQRSGIKPEDLEGMTAAQLLAKLAKRGLYINYPDEKRSSITNGELLLKWRNQQL